MAFIQFVYDKLSSACKATYEKNAKYFERGLGYNSLRELKFKSQSWFYTDVSRKYRRFGSAKVVRTLYKHTDGSGHTKFHSDNESDSGYDPSLYSSFGQSGSLRPTKARPSLHAVFPEIRICDEDGTEIENGLFSPPPIPSTNHVGKHSVSVATNGNHDNLESSPDTSFESIPMGTQTTSLPSPSMTTTPTQTSEDLQQKEKEKRDIYKEAFENTLRTEEAKFKVRFDNLLSEMQESFEKLPSRDQYGSTSYGDLMTNYRSRVKDLLVSLSQRLELAVESFDETCANNPSLTSLKVRQIISKLIEDRLGENLDLTSDEAVSDLSSLSDESSEQKSLEEQIAQAVIARMLELHRNQNGIHLDLDEPRLADERCYSSNSEVKIVGRSRDSSLSEEPQVHENVPKEKKLSTSDTQTDMEKRLSTSDTQTDKKKKISTSDTQTDAIHILESERDINANEKTRGVFIEPVGETSDTEVTQDLVDGEEMEAYEADKTNQNNVSAKQRVFRSLSNDTDEADQKKNKEDEDILRLEFEKLRSFAKEVVPKPLYEAVKYEEDIEDEEDPVDESMDYKIIDHEESQNEFESRMFTFDKVHDSEHHSLPDFSDLDYEYHDFGVTEVDPDLLSMNLAPILEETEEELAEEVEEEEEEGGATGAEGGVSGTDWRGNWMFKGAAGMDTYENLSRREKQSLDFGEGIVRVPQPNVNLLAPTIGNRDVDEMSSDLSDEESHDASDEGDSFYAKTSEEIARISLSRSRRSVHTDSEHEIDTNISSHSASFSDSGVNTNLLGTASLSSSRMSLKTAVKLSEDLIPSERDDPKFEIPPVSVTICEGEPAKFTCRVAGSQTLDIFWYRVLEEVEELENSEYFEIIKDGCRQSLTMYNMTTEHAGQYMCMAINENGRCCQYFILTVKKNTTELKAPEFLKTLTDVEVIEGQSVKFRVKVKGIPQPRVVWFKDGQILLNQLNYKLERFGNRDYILAITTASMDEDAEYSALAKNIAGEARSSAQLIVEPKDKPESVPPKTKKSSFSDSNSISTESKKPKEDFPDLSYLRLGRSRTSANKSATSSSLSSSSAAMPGASEPSVVENDSSLEIAADVISSIAAMDKMLADLECDSTSSTSDDLDPTPVDLVTSLGAMATLEFRNQCVVMESSDYPEVQSAADASIVRRRKPADVMTTSTPRNSETERVFQVDSDTSNIPCDNSMVAIETSHDGDNQSYKSEISLNPMTTNMSASAKNGDSSAKPLTRSVLTARGYSQSDDMDVNSRTLTATDRQNSTDSDRTSSMNVSFERNELSSSLNSSSSECLVVNLGPKSENLEPYRKDFYINSPPTSPRGVTPSSRESTSRESTPLTSPRSRTEEKIVLSAPVSRSVGIHGNTSLSLEEKVRALQQIQLSDTRTTINSETMETPPPPKVVASSKAYHAPKPPPPRPITPPPIEKPEPTFLKGITSESDLPESRTEFNEEYSIELPSVNRLKAMFGGTKQTEKDSSIKRDTSDEMPIHSITARSVPKEQLERLKDSSGDTSGAIDSSANDTKPVQPGRSTALTTGQQIKQTPNMPKQVYHFSEDNKSKKQSTHIPKQSVQISSSVKPVGQAKRKISKCCED
ncbi:uncharacterized protein LOC127864044 isoform X4 [Dreissena polymorpha]|uniref:uncharacterized protein LOC127864044 isoform X4 n=1 Tax=Dreissena polymorpha TaxID=45954 RepID=UPI0022655E10|nr:uncharacterized protein LOC127864044 isoform X4 [Dreissena polymorpha]